MTRVDNASIPKGKTVTISIKADNEPSVGVVFMGVGMESEALPSMVSGASGFWSASLKTPARDGFLLISAGGRSIVKKVGFPSGLFVIGHRSTADSIPVYQLDAEGHLIQTSDASRISEGFYAVRLHASCVIIRTLGKLFDVRGYSSNIGVDVEIPMVEVQEIAMVGVALPTITIRDVTLPALNIDGIELPDIVLPIATITEQ